jgi:hypothetical protein
MAGTEFPASSVHAYESVLRARPSGRPTRPPSSLKTEETNSNESDPPEREASRLGTLSRGARRERVGGSKRPLRSSASSR